ncbi:MAG: helix-turn-helix domain-containing protein [Fusobacterium sp. JB020]|nr:helix-turn-helix domain-containing protein [Fusobacterium sp. JB020]
MDEKNDIQIKRFKIIEPFLRKEKKLREIELESGISYATLKRWTKAYKENGIIGLDKKRREDKNSFKSVDKEEINLIKKLCKNSDDGNISKLYNKYTSFFKNKKYNISYPTFYRIVNNIDHFFKKSSDFHLKKIKKENEIYVVIEIPTYILVNLDAKIKKVPNLIIMFDASNLEVINFSIAFETSNIYSLLGFIRQSILKVSSLNGKLKMPKEILIDTKNSIPRNVAKSIFDVTTIKVSEYSYNYHNDELLRFLNFLKEDLYKEFKLKNKNITSDELITFLNSYIYLDSTKYNYIIEPKLLEKQFHFRVLDVFLQSSTRKIYSSAIRFKNLLYKDEFLKNLEGKEIEIKSNPLDYNFLHLFSNGKFIGMVEF